MTQSSHPSKKVILLDVPEVKEFSGEFRYNFFTRDESGNDSGVAPRGVLDKPSESIGTDFTESNDYNRFTPRYIKLTWKKVNIGNRPELSSVYSIKANNDKIQAEDKFSANDFANVVFQDTAFDGKMAFYVQKAIERLVPTDGISSRANSPQDYAREVAARTQAHVTNEFLSTALFNPTDLGLTFASADTNVSSLLEKLKEQRFGAQINTKLIGKALQTINEDVVTPFSDEVSDVINQARQLEQQASSNRSSSVFNVDDYDIEIGDYVSIKKIDTASYDNIVQSIGYIIEKTEVLPNGTQVKLPNLFIENPAIESLPDPEIKYGSTYFYSIRSVAYVETQAQQLASGGTVLAVGFLVASQSSPIKVVRCVDTTPPPPPADFNVGWDQKNQCVRLIWSFPVNTQRDIKKFQIMCRNSILEPFQLIKMFDFDDSEIKIPFNETPDPSLVELTLSPVNHYLDREFVKSSSPKIYALCSVDAHGQVSNYSMQMQCQFDRFANKLVLTKVSVAGAPRAYPNAFLNTDTFVDTIKDEGHTNMKIVFNPEFLKAVSASGHDLGLLKTGANDTYRLQLINVDLQKQEVIEVKLNANANTLLRQS